MECRKEQPWNRFADGLCGSKDELTSGGPDFRQPQALLRISVSRAVRADMPAALEVEGLGVDGVDMMKSLLESIKLNCG